MISTTYWKAACLSLLLFPGFNFAQTIPIETLIQKTLTSHPEILAAKAKKESLMRLVEQSSVGLNPSLDLSVGRKSNNQKSGLTYETTLKQTIVNSEKINSKKALAQVEVFEQDLELKKLTSKLRYEVLTEAYNWNRYHQQFEFNQARMKKLNWIKQYLASRPFIAPQKRLEIKLIESHLRELQAESLQLSSQKALARAALQALISEPLPEELAIALPKIQFKTTPNVALLSEKIGSQNSEVQVLKIQLEEVELEKNVLQADAKSDFDIFGRYASESASETEQFLSVGIGMDLAFANKNRFAIQAQNKKMDVLQAELDQLTKENTRKLQQAVISLKNSQDILTLYNNTWLQQLEASLDQSIDGFKKGQTELLSVLELESQWDNASAKSYEAEATWINSWSILMQLTNEAHLPGDSL